MLNQIIPPSSVYGKINAPSSKSSAQRACAAALLNNGKSVINNFGNSNDEQIALGIIKDLGAHVLVQNKQLQIVSIDSIFLHGTSLQKNLFCGESGLSMRMFAPIAALFDDEIIFSGSGSILQRPMHFFDEFFPQLGVKINSNNGNLPIQIQGPLQPKDILVDGSVSSQFLTGLLFAFAKSCKELVTITAENLNSRPYIDLTLSILAHFGFNVEHENYQVFTIFPRTGSTYFEVNYTVEGDWSNAAFLLVAAAIAGEISVTGLDINSTQGDKKILEALRDCGAIISISQNEINVKIDRLNAFEFDATDCPDLFPPLVALAAHCKGTSIIKGVNRLLHKESNRALTLQEEFKKMNVQIELDNDFMKIIPPNSIVGTTIFSHHDHRIAMACAVAGLKAQGNTHITGAIAVNKSYPDFFSDLNSLLLNQ
jgi:3-phosphoshikimate 1-carboxyvinyltransferase